MITAKYVSLGVKMLLTSESWWHIATYSFIPVELKQISVELWMVVRFNELIKYLCGLLLFCRIDLCSVSPGWSYFWNRNNWQVCCKHHENLLKTIIPFALVGYEVIITNSRYALVGYFITSYPTRAHEIVVIYLQIIPCTLRMHKTPLAKEREHLNGFKWLGRLVRLSLYF